MEMKKPCPQLTVVREVPKGWRTPEEEIINSTAVIRLFEDYFEQLDREVFLSIVLDTKKHLLGFEVVSIGCLTASIVHPREVFKALVLANAAAVVFAHNHPSGNPTPGNEDLEITRRLRDCGALLGIEVVDHVVFGAGRHVSMRDEGLW